jgi:hypothetical protein
MARTSPVYPTFARGEVNPLMFGRVDVDPYTACLDKCRNCWVRPYGVVSRMVGSEYITNTKNNGKARLLRFVFSAQDSYIIECGAGYFRFFNNGGYVVNGNNEVYEISNPFTEAQLKTIKYVQLDDVIKIVYKDDTGNTNKPLELIRHASNNWELKETTFKCTPFLDENITSTTLMASAATGNITVSASTAIFNANHVGSYWWMGEKTTVDNIEKQGFFKITGFTDSTHVSATVQWKLSTTSATKLWGEGAWSKHRGYPSVIGLMDGRLYYGRTPNSPRNIYGSQPYAYEDFTPALNNEDSGAINVELATNACGDGSDIRWITGQNFLLVGTYGNEFVVKGTDDSGIKPTDVSARARSNWGSEDIQPISVDSMIHFVQRTGKKIRQFTYDYYLDAYKAVDISLYSDHLLESPLVEVAYQKNPDSILWCLREDGQIALLTLETNQQVQAWSMLEFPDAHVESIETIPSYDGMYDEVYMIVRRQVNGSTVRHVERVQNLITPDIQAKCWYVRDGMNYDAFDNTDGISLTLSAKTGNDITITAGSSAFTSAMVGRRLRAVDSELNILGEAVITEYTSDTVVKARVRKEFTATSYSGGSWGVSVRTLSGLGHLEGKTLEILADGAVQTPQTVTSGSLSLELDAFYIIVGLGYQSYFKLMPLEAGSETGTAIGKRKRVNELSLRVWKTSGCRVGGGLENLQQITYRRPQTQLGTPEQLFTGILPNIKFNQGWVWDATITVEQSQPLPMNVLAIAPIINEIDK